MSEHLRLLLDFIFLEIFFLLKLTSTLELRNSGTIHTSTLGTQEYPDFTSGTVIVHVQRFLF